MNNTILTRWRLGLFARFLGIWAAVLVAYLTIAELAGGVTTLLNTVYGSGWSAITLIILFLILLGVGYGLFWLGDREHERSTSIIWSVIGIIVLAVATGIGYQWVTWAWSILLTIPLAVPLILGAALSVWLAERAWLESIDALDDEPTDEDASDEELDHMLRA